jgi:hypothetical protein
VKKAVVLGLYGVLMVIAWPLSLLRYFGLLLVVGLIVMASQP